MYSDRELEEKDVFILISYVDDVLICIKGTADESEEEMEKKARTARATITERAERKGMTFAENKTKTWHGNRDEDTHLKLSIGTHITELRFLGNRIKD